MISSETDNFVCQRALFCTLQMHSWIKIITIIINDWRPASTEVMTKQLRCELRAVEKRHNCAIRRSARQTATCMHVENVILIFLRSSSNHADLRSDLFNLNMFHLITYFAAVMLIQGTVFMCETSFSPISRLSVNLVI